MYLFKYFLNLLLFAPALLISQNYPEPKFNKDFTKVLNEKFDTKYFTFEKQYEKGKRLLNVSHSGAEFARSYGNMGYAKYKLFQYSEAIPLMEKAKLYANKSNYVLYMFGMNITLKDAYRQSGLLKKSEECWQEAQNIAKKYNDDNLYFTLYYVFAQDYEKEGKYTEAIAYLEKQLELIKGDKKNILTAASINSNIAYDYLKQNNTNRAKEYLEKATPVIENKENTHQIQELEIYYLAKALYAFKSQKHDEAKKYFKLGLDEAKRRDDKDQFVLITEELLKTNIHFPDNELIFKKYIDNQNTRAGEIKKVVGKDEFHKDQIIKTSTNYISYLIISIICIAAFVSLQLYLYRRKNKHLKTKIDRILDEFNKSNEATKSEPRKNKDTTEAHKNVRTAKETEEQLLQKIEEFEKGNVFTEKNFTMAKMAALLESNSIHINYVLQKYRGKTFSDFINELKINYIVRLLINDPKYLNYKISYLSDLAGFSNHSRFTQIFKKQLKISPSEFISDLEAKNILKK